MKYVDFMHILFASIAAVILLSIPFIVSSKPKKANCRKCVYSTDTGCSILTWEEKVITDGYCGFYREKVGEK